MPHHFKNHTLSSMVILQVAGPTTLDPKAIMTANNNQAASSLLVFFILCYACFVLANIPHISQWFATGQFASGWYFTTISHQQNHQVKKSALAAPPPTVHISSSPIFLAWSRYLATNFISRPVSISIPKPSLALSSANSHVWTIDLDHTWGQLVLLGAYQIAIFIFLFIYDGGTFPTNPQRPAMLGLAQLPLVFVFAAKNSLISVILGRGYEKLNFLHRAVGYTTLVYSLAHAGFFIWNAHNRGVRIDYTQPVMCSGLFLTVLCPLIIVTGVPIFRRRAYQLFLVSHILGWILFIVGLNIHAETARFYTLFALILYGLDYVARAIKTHHCTAVVTSLTPLPAYQLDRTGGLKDVQNGTEMTLLEIPTLNSGWLSGQHVWIRLVSFKDKTVSWPLTHKIQNHPFSISTFPGYNKGSSPSSLRLMIKGTGKWTMNLNQHSGKKDFPRKEWQEVDIPSYSGTPLIDLKNVASSDMRVQVVVEGPYGGPGYTLYSSFQSIMLVVGGSGISFAASVLEDLVSKSSQNESHVKLVVLVWAIKELSCLDWYEENLLEMVERLSKTMYGMELRIKLFVTGQRTGLPSEPPTIPSSLTLHCRPNLDILVEDIVQETCDVAQTEGVVRGGGVLVAGCGPASLVRSVRSACASLSKEKSLKSGGVVCHVEAFSW